MNSISLFVLHFLAALALLLADSATARFLMPQPNGLAILDESAATPTNITGYISGIPPWQEGITWTGWSAHGIVARSSGNTAMAYIVAGPIGLNADHTKFYSLGMNYLLRVKYMDNGKYIAPTAVELTPNAPDFEGLYFYPPMKKFVGLWFNWSAHDHIYSIVSVDLDKNPSSVTKLISNLPPPYTLGVTSILIGDVVFYIAQGQPALVLVSLKAGSYKKIAIDDPLKLWDGSYSTFFALDSKTGALYFTNQNFKVPPVISLWRFDPKTNLIALITNSTNSFPRNYANFLSTQFAVNGNSVCTFNSTPLTWLCWNMMTGEKTTSAVFNSGVDNSKVWTFV